MMLDESAVVKKEYEKDQLLKCDDVQKLLDWIQKQPHLPKISELQAILFLQSCYYSNEMAKIRLDNYFTFKTMSPEIFGNKNPHSPALTEAFNTLLVSVLPEKTPEGYVIGYAKILDSNPEHCNIAIFGTMIHMIHSGYVHKNGTNNGIIIICDMDGIVFGHLFCLIPSVLRKLFVFIVDAAPIRLKQIHCINVIPFIEKAMTILKPLMPKELLEMLHFHLKKVDTLYNYVPQKCMPNELGGNAGSFKTLHENTRKLLDENEDLYKWEDSQLVNENYRLEKSRKITLDKIFGVDGTFKKLEVD